MDTQTFSPALISKYCLVRYLARGGMSDVYLVRNECDGQLYALKVVRTEEKGSFRHFWREVSMLGVLRHEHILPLIEYSVGQDGPAYHVTPYIANGSLKERLEAGPLSLQEAASILEQVGEALQFIHDLGLVHGDLKPANMLLDAGNHVWLADFGLTQEADAPDDLFNVRYLLGTPFYIAPELLEGPASVSSDIYALGIVLYEMLTGTPPFTGPSSLATCWKHVYQLPPLPSRFNPRIPLAVEQVILRALEKKPADRFASVREMVAAYQQALLAPAVPSRFADATSLLAAEEDLPVLPRFPPARSWSINPLAVTVIMLAVLIALGITGWALH